jgi:hypothetical protein
MRYTNLVIFALAATNYQASALPIADPGILDKVTGPKAKLV